MLWVELETLEIFQKILFVKMISIYYFFIDSYKLFCIFAGDKILILQQNKRL